METSEKILGNQVSEMRPYRIPTAQKKLETKQRYQV